MTRPSRIVLVVACLAALAVPAALFAPAAVDAATAPPLRLRTPPHGGYSVRLPTNWRFRDASYPSDHATHLWWNPVDPLQKLEVVLSACVGCATRNLDPYQPNPRGLVPTGATAVRLSIWTYAYQIYGSDNPFPDNGVVTVTHDSRGRVNGWARADLWLPRSQHALATTILNSFRISGS